MKKTALYEKHMGLNARMIEFGGWEMPLQYTKIMEEHMAVRKHAGIFDVSHMGDVIIRGKDANSFVDYILPTKASELEENGCTYTAFLDENGNIIDDTIIYRIEEDKFFFVPNAGPTEEIVDWIGKYAEKFDVEIENRSRELSSIALQGPESVEILQEMGLNLPDMFTFYQTDASSLNPLTGNRSLIVSGTGYTGEKGVEFILPNDQAPELWDTLMKLLGRHDGLPCGLGARDTLRMEKGMLLSGHDFDHDRTPYECSISFIMNEDHDFVGKKGALESKDKSRTRFRGFVMLDKGIPREECYVYNGADKIGTITSGTLSPVLNKGIGLGYIDKRFMKSGGGVDIEIRGKRYGATVSKPKIVP